MSENRISDLSSLKRRLAVLFAVTAAAVVAGGLAYDHSYRSSLIKDSGKLLISIEDFKIQQLNYWRNDRLNDTMSLLDSPLLSAYLAGLAVNPSDMVSKTVLTERLEAYSRNNSYTGAMISGLDGKVLVSAGYRPKTICKEARELLRKADVSGRSEMGDFYVSPGDQKPHIDLVARAAKGPAGKNIFLLLRIDPHDYIYPLIEKWPTNSRTGETLLARREGDTIVFLNEIRHISGAAMKLQLPASTPGLPAAIAFTGKAGIVRGRDYRGVEVLAAVNTIPGTDWGIVTKLDMAEVLADSARVSLLLLLLTLSVLGGAASGAYLLFRRQAEEYRRAYAELGRQTSKLKDSYECLTAQANDAILVADSQTLQILESNRKSREIYGYTEEEFLRLKTSDLVPENGITTQKERLERLRKGSGTMIETEHKRKNGELFPAEVSSAYTSSSGKDYIFAIIRDLSERKRMIRTLRENERKLAALFSNLPGIAYRCRNDKKWSMEFLSESCKKLTGYEISELVGPGALSFNELIIPKDRERVWTEIQAALAENRNFQLTYDLRRKNGEIRTMWEQGLGVRAQDGSIEALEGFISDITERRQAEEALQVSERALREAQEMAHLGYWNWDIKTGAVEWSDEVYRIFRLDPERFTPKIDSILELSPWPEENARDQELIQRATKTREKGAYTQRFLRPDKSVGYYHSTFQGKYDEQGALVSIVGTVLDITERKLADLALEKLNRDLIEKKQEMENFLYITTHDLRTPLVNIQGFSQNLEQYMLELKGGLDAADLPPGTKEAFEKLTAERIPTALKFVLESSRKMDALITALLKVSRMGRVEMKPETVAMNELVEKVLESLRYQLESAGGEVKLGNLPPCKADPGAVNQLFTNLLDNAIKYRQQGRPLAVGITGGIKDGMAFYSVRDNGSGIKKDDRDRIWDIFYRPESAKENKGEGIGLPMVKRIAEKNGGNITVESEFGEGSVFHVSLPSAKAE